jgi:hypothetical protein
MRGAEQRTDERPTVEKQGGKIFRPNKKKKKKKERSEFQPKYYK